MALKRPYVVMLVVVFGLAGWKVWDVVTRGNENVLALTTTRTMEERVTSLENRVYYLEKNAGLISSKGTSKTKESFVSLLGGDINSLDWAKIFGTDFTLDTSLYGKTVEVSWQGWLQGTGAVRLYDSTNHRAVDFSEYVSSSDGKKSFYSKAMSIWRGQNQYYVEGKTTNGVITLSAPRLKIVTR